MPRQGKKLVFRRCSNERKGDCHLLMLSEEELRKACQSVLEIRRDEETAFAGKVSKLTIYDDRLVFSLKEGVEKEWQRR